MSALLDVGRLPELTVRPPKEDALPFACFVVEPFLDPKAFGTVMQALPERPEEDWFSSEETTDGRLRSHNKFVVSKLERLAPVIRQLVEELISASFIQYLETITGIRGLIPDGTHHGGLMHYYLPGAFLAVHVDANVHPVTKLDRRLNLILYLNKRWEGSWGGDLESWHAQKYERVLSISPSSNRCVIFATTPESQHAMSLLTSPGDIRKSLFLRYYSEGRPAEERRPPHRARWIGTV